MTELRPGTQVKARGLRREVYYPCISEQCRRYRPRSLLATGLDPYRAARLLEWRVDHDTFILEQALGRPCCVGEPAARDLARGADLVTSLRGGAG